MFNRKFRFSYMLGKFEWRDIQYSAISSLDVTKSYTLDQQEIINYINSILLNQKTLFHCPRQSLYVAIDL